MELLPDFGYDLLRRFVDVHRDGRLGFLQVGELRCKNLPVGKVPLPQVQTTSNQIRASFQINKLDVRSSRELFPIAFLQSRAGQHYTDSGRTPVRNIGAKESQPRLAVCIGQRDTMANLLNVSRGVEVVGVSELPPQLLR